MRLPGVKISLTLVAAIYILAATTPTAAHSAPKCGIFVSGTNSFVCRVSYVCKACGVPVGRSQYPAFSLLTKQQEAIMATNSHSPVGQTVDSRLIAQYKHLAELTIKAADRIVMLQGRIDLEYNPSANAKLEPIDDESWELTFMLAELNRQARAIKSEAEKLEALGLIYGG